MQAQELEALVQWSVVSGCVLGAKAQNECVGATPRTRVTWLPSYDFRPILALQVAAWVIYTLCGTARNNHLFVIGWVVKDGNNLSSNGQYDMSGPTLAKISPVLFPSGPTNTQEKPSYLLHNYHTITILVHQFKQKGGKIILKGYSVVKIPAEGIQHIHLPHFVC